MKTSYVVGVFALIILGILVWENFFPEKIDKEIPAVLSIADKPDGSAASSSSEEEEISYNSKPTTIHVKGEVYRRLFRNPHINVKITVDGFDWMEGEKAVSPYILFEKEGAYVGMLGYGNPESDIELERTTKLVPIWFEKDFSNIHISGSTEEWMGDKSEDSRSLYITGEAKDTQQMEAVLEDMRKRFGYDDNGPATQKYTEIPGPGLSP